MIILCGKYIYVYPTFLYESVITFFIFILLYILRKRKKENGDIFYLYMILYGIGRAIVEGLRIDSLYLYNLRISQILALVFIVVFSILLVYKKVKIKKY